MLQKKLLLFVMILLDLTVVSFAEASQPVALNLAEFDLTPAAHNQTNPGAKIPTFEPGACTFEFDYSFSTPEDENIECGYLLVPERRGDPDGSTLRLAVAILKSHSLNPAPDPLVMAQGGPGGSTIELAEALISSPLRARRDLILFDQRGTLHSEPSLACPEVITLTEEIIDQDLSFEQELELSQEAMLACRERLAAEGIDLAAFNSLENAADVEALRVALGYDQINLYGISYGTLLALHTMRDYPHGLRSVILDAVVPPQTNFILEIPHTTDRAFSQLFNACAAHPTCQADYPDLEQRFFDLVTTLNQQPVTVPVTDSETGQSYRAVLDGDDLVDVLFQYLYQTEFIPILPKLIDDVRSGDYTFLSNTLPLFIFDRTFSFGMYQSVVCAEDANFRGEDLNVDDVRPQLLVNIELENEAFLTLCADWGVPRLDPLVDEPVASSIPTLLLSGQFDPITPPAYAELVAQTLPQSYAYTFPVNGHGAALPGSDCSNRIIQVFLDNPQVEPDASCLREQPALPRFLPAETLTVGFVGALATAPTLNHLIVFALFGASILALLSAWIIWPLGMLIHWFRNRSFPRQPGTARLARWLAVLVGLLSLLFVVVFGGVIIFTLVDSQNLSLLLIGLPGEVAPLFVLPPLLVFLTAGMIVATAVAWFRGYWSLLGRAYYTLLTLFALIYSGVLIQTGMASVLF